jgi:hypothetical protein
MVAPYCAVGWVETSSTPYNPPKLRTSTVFTSNGIDIETKTKRGLDTWFFSISKRSEPVRSENFIIEDDRTELIQIFLGSKQKRRELVLNFSRLKRNKKV